MGIGQVWIIFLCVYKMNLAQMTHLDQTAALMLVEPGKAVTFQCTFEEKSSDILVWYKQRPGQIPQRVGTGISGTVNGIIFPPFNKSAFKLEKTKNTVSLTVLHVTKGDEGMYMCGISQVNVIRFLTGTFLAVTDHADLNSVSLLQSPARSVSPGERVTLQCTVLSEIRSADLQVFWFRPAAGQSFPEIIYTHHNSSRQCEISSSSHSYMYNFSKNILNHSDTGTYYCAVSTCGKIIFGNGTTVNLMCPVKSLIIYLTVALGMCVMVISVQAIVICKRINCNYCVVEKPHQGVGTKKTNQDQEVVELNYASLHFNKSKTKRDRKRQPKDCVYSEVKHSNFTDCMITE